MELTERQIKKEDGEITEKRYTLELNADQAADKDWITHQEWVRLQDMIKLGYEVDISVVITERPGQKDTARLWVNLEKQREIDGSTIPRS